MTTSADHESLLSRAFPWFFGGVDAPERTLRQLSTFYIAALATVAALVIAGQVIVQLVLRDQRADSRVINLAGRQRMYSQKIAKTALKLAAADDDDRRSRLADVMAEDARVWTRSQQGLRHGDRDRGLPWADDPRVVQQFERVAIHQEAMLRGVRTVLDGADPQTGIEQILRHEPSFLQEMDALVFELDEVARRKVETLSRTEALLMILTLGVLAFEGWFVFRPTIRRLARAVEAERQLERTVVDAMERTRARLGQDLHDGVCQQLAGTAYLARAELKLQPPSAGVPVGVLKKLAELIEEANRQARTVALGLYPPALSDRPLADVLGNLARQEADLGWPVEVDADADLILDHAVALHLYRVAQEALSNARRHSRGTGSTVSLQRDGRQVVLRVDDDGTEPVTEGGTQGIGLRTMRRRARLLGGALTVGRRPEGGTRVELIAPLTLVSEPSAGLEDDV